LFLILGGVVGSALVLTASVAVGLWLWNSDYFTKAFAARRPEVGTPPNANTAVEPPKNGANAPLASNSQLAPDVLQRVKQATVYLRVILPDGQMLQGSGFFGVEPQIILTNAHVLGMLEAEGGKPKKIEVVTSSGSRDEKRFTARVLGVDRGSDLAVLKSDSKDVPPPLDVRSAGNLQETQQVYVFGFPFGEGLGREITVSQSSVSSLRREHGMVTRVQVNGGMHPGNSGGPVVDVAGNVVGVAVSVLRYTQINFAVPGDYVHYVLNGHFSELTLLQPYLHDGKITVPVSMPMIDPLGRIERPAVEVWTGASGASRPRAMSQPPVHEGDTPHQPQSLSYREGMAKGEVTLPALPPGKVYWVQPTWVNGAGNDQWGPAKVYTPPTPVERRSIALACKHEPGVRPLTLRSSLTLRMRSMSGRGRALDAQGMSRLTANEEARFTETTRSVDAGGTAKVRLQYESCTFGARVNNRELPLGQDTQRALKDVKALAVDLQIGKSGSVDAHQVDTSRAPEGSRRDLAQLQELVEQSLEVLTVPLPNKQVAAGTSWQAVLTLPIHIQGKRFETGTVAMTYTYLGVRKREGREEALLDLEGTVRGSKTHISGRAEGSVVFDLALGQVRENRTTYYLDLDLKLERVVRGSGTLQMRLHRDLAPLRSASKSMMEQAGVSER
jgi:S1-C subfamily serine protease